MGRLKDSLVLAALLIPLGGALSACDEGPAENAGEAVDDAADEAGDTVEDATD